jgi:2-oxoisovalerate dehydrogenase E1 component alpha subunit
MIALGLTPREFALGLMGKRGEPSSGARQMPSHWSLRRANVISHSSPVATQTPHAAGLGLAIKLNRDDAVVLTTVGEGSTAQGEWYEGINWAAIHRLPVIFLVENNIYAISVRQERQMAVDSVADKASGLGLPGVSVDGLDALAVHQAVSQAAGRAREGDGPTLIEARVQRMTPHSSDDDDRAYRTREEVEAMKTNDPLARFRDHLMQAKILLPDAERDMEGKAKDMVEDAIAFAQGEPYPETSEAAYPVYAGEVRHE